MASRIALVNETVEEPETFEFSSGKVVALCRGWEAGSRENEDSLLVHEAGDSVVLAVADGAGGGPTGAKASRLTIQALEKCLLENSGDIRAAILDGFESANQELLSVGTGLGTTLSVVELRHHDGAPTFRSYHVGDSSVLVTGARGKLKLTTVSHSPVGYGVEAGLISETEALHHDDLNLVSNLVGMANMRIEMGSEIKLDKRDTVVLGSDGLFDNLHSEEVVQIARRGPLLDVVRNLRNKAVERMGGLEPDKPSKPDDLSVIAFRRT
jgi:serine/threonine protein phosphatase PrpC